jgi:hypothetical protein
MISPNPVEEAVLSKWGITVLSEEGPSPEESLLKFLTKLKQHVDME